MPYYDMVVDDFAASNHDLIKTVGTESEPAAIQRHALALARRYRSVWHILELPKLADRLGLPRDVAVAVVNAADRAIKHDELTRSFVLT